MTKTRGAGASPRQLRATAKRLLERAKELEQEALRLNLEADKLERAEDAAQITPGAVVYLRSIPFGWMFSSTDAPSFQTQLRIDKLGPKRALVRRVDGRDFPFSRRSYKQVWVRRTDLRLTPP